MANNKNVLKVIPFQEVMRRVRNAAYEWDDDINGYWSDPGFTARDKTGKWAAVRRDGEHTVKLHIYSGAYLKLVPMDSVEIILAEHGFDNQRAAWQEDYDHFPLPNDEPGYIYFIQMEGSTLYKIGRTKEHKSRTSLLGVLMPKPADFIGVWRVGAMRTVEMMIHEDYAVFHSNGEWFDIPDISNLMEYMNMTYVRIV